MCEFISQDIIVSGGVKKCNWRASEASETLSGVTQSRFRYIYLFIYLFIYLYGT